MCAPAGAEMEEDMKTILFVLLEQWSDWEAAYLSSGIQMLNPGEYTNKIVSVKRGGVESIGGFRAEADYDLDSVPDDYEAVILVGGMSWRSETAQKVKPLVERCMAEGKVLGAICDAAGFLAAAGALNSVMHTGNDLNDVKTWAGSAYTGEKRYLMRHAVRDGVVITANGTAALEFAKEVMLALKAAPEKIIEEWYSFHKLGGYIAPLPGM